MVTSIFIIFAIVLILSLLPLKDSLKQPIWAILSIGLIIFTGFRDGDSIRDYFNYVSAFNRSDLNSLFEREFSYDLISYFIKQFLGGDVIFLFVIYAIIGVSLKMIAIRELSCFCFFSLLIYIGNYFPLHELTQMRAGIASGFLLFCIKPIYDRDLKKFLLFALLAFFFHYSALVILPLWFLRGHKMNKLLFASIIPLGYLIYFIGFSPIVIIPISGIQKKMEIYLEAQEFLNSETNVFNSIFLVKIAIYYFLLSKLDYIQTKSKYAILLMKIYVISLFSLLLLAKLPVVAFRISELLGVVDIILIPLLLYMIKPQILSKLLVICIALGLLLFNIYYFQIFQI